MDSLTFKKNVEYEVILSKLQRDVERKKWTAGYPINTLVEKLINNSPSQGLHEQDGGTAPEEAEVGRIQLAVLGQCGPGGVQTIPKEVASQYKGAVNYISMVEAFKASPFATTPLRICMNSSMKQPRPYGVSLNDCLLKGPPALADLYTVTLGIREHKVAFTKDISKFY
jgi:hypothetical protein